MVKAISLLSGGLDSILATRLVLDQGIGVEAINFVTVFCTCTSRGSSCLASEKASRQLGVKLKVINVSEDYLELVKSPRFGYGSNMNPCLDCRIFMLKKAKQYMEETGASFIVTGEVLGERPMSQRRDALNIIEREAGLKGLILRPLSAKHFAETVPEKNGWVDREKLLAIVGRSRKPQLELARQLNISDYPCPAGGCLLTDPEFSRRLKDLFEHNPDFSLNDIHLLKLGRHIRLSDKLKVIVGRNNSENEKLATFAQGGDVLFRLRDYPGPLALARGEVTQDFLEKAAELTARYSKARNQKEIKVNYWPAEAETDKATLTVGGKDEEVSLHCA